MKTITPLSQLLPLLIPFILLMQTANSQVTCPSDYFYFNNQCYSACNIEAYQTTNGQTNPDSITEFYHKTQTSQLCVSECSSECMTCRTYADFCTSCVQPVTDTAFLLETEGKCFVAKCPVLYFQNNLFKTCISCSTLSLNCNNCTVNKQCLENGGSETCNAFNSVLCLSCDIGYFQLVDNNGLLQCIPTIPDGYISINGKLTPCANECLTCRNFPMTCLSCKTLNFHNSQCLPTCPTSHYSVSTITSVNQTEVLTLECTRCKPNCNTCMNEQFCLSCLIGYYLLESQGVCITPTACPEGTFANTSSYMCETCRGSCVRCYNGNQCKECVTGLSLLGRTCFQQCPERTYPSTIPDSLSQNLLTAICTACVSPCDKCINQNTCLGCLKSTGLFYLQEENECVQACPKGMKPDRMAQTCINCPLNCSTCDQYQCTQCQTIDGLLYTLVQGRCVSECPKNYYLKYLTKNIVAVNSQITVKTCELCPFSCQVCANHTFCTSCRLNYYYNSDNNECLSQCPSEKPVETPIQLSPTLYQCLPCSDPLCLQCTKLDYCYHCLNQSSLDIAQSTVLIDGFCYFQCPILYFKTFNTEQNIWICLPDSTKQIDNTTGEVVTILIPAKGVIVKVFYPFFFSYFSGGTFVIIGMGFLFGRACNAKRGLYIAFVTGLLALPETLTIGVCLFYHFMYNYYDYVERIKLMEQLYILTIAVIFYVILSITNMAIFIKIVSNDSSYKQWKAHSSRWSHFLLYFISAVSLVNFKFQNLFWSKFSTFPVLQSVEKLKIFTVISGLSLVSVCAFVVVFVFLSFKEGEIKLVYYDGIAVLIFCSLVNFLSLKRPDDLFVFQGDDELPKNLHGQESNSKINLHKRSFATEALFNASLKPIKTYEQAGIRSCIPKNTRLISSEDILFSSRNSQKTLIQSQESSFMSRVTQQQKSSIIFQLRDQNNQSILVVDNPDQNNYNKICLYNRKHHQRLHHSLNGLYSQSRSEIQTDQSSEQDTLNQAISQLEQGSQKAEMGSEEDDALDDWEVFNGKKKYNEDFPENENKKCNRQSMIQQFKQNLKLIESKMPVKLPQQKRNPPFSMRKQQIDAANISDNSQLFVKFLDVSELQDIKDPSIKIHSCQNSHFHDEVNISEQSHRESHDDKGTSIIDRKEENIRNSLWEKIQGQINSMDNNTDFSQDEPHQTEGNLSMRQVQVINVNQNNNGFPQHSSLPSEHSRIQQSQPRQHYRTNVGLTTQNDKQSNIQNQKPLSKTDFINLTQYIKLHPQQNQQKQQNNKLSHLNNIIEQPLQKSRDIQIPFSQQNEQSITSNIQLIDIVKSETAANIYRQNLRLKAPKNKSQLKQSFQSCETQYLKDHPGNQQQEGNQSANESAGQVLLLDENNKIDKYRQLKLLEEEQPEQQPLRQTNQEIDISDVQQESDQCSTDAMKKLFPLMQGPTQTIEQNHFRIQTKIKKSTNKKSRQNILKDQVLVLDDKKFRSLKKKLKSIEKQEQKKVKILRNIEQGRFLLNQYTTKTNFKLSNHAEKRMSHQSRSIGDKDASEQKKHKNRVLNLTGQSKEKMNEIQKPPRRVSKKKIELDLQSKLHVQKIYNNRFSDNYRSTSQEQKSAVSQTNGQKRDSVEKDHVNIDV